MQEGLRMAGTMPLLSDIEPALHFGGDLTAGTMQSGTRSIALTYGESAGKALVATEAGVTASARADSLGAKAEPGKPSRSAVVGVLRLPTPEAAAAAVSPGLLAGEEAVFGVKSPAKVPSAIPGYPAAVAYTQAWTATTSFVAFLAHRQFVIAVYSNWSPDQVKSYFDRQIKGLEGFVPTAADKFSTLPLDASGVAKLTLPSGGKFNGYSADANIVVRNQTDVTRSVKTFADAGVDVVASAGSSIYRARDAKGAQHVADEFRKETTETYPSSSSESVNGVPGGTCITYAGYEGATEKTTYCFVAVGRYLAEVSSKQRQQAIQALGASYLIIRSQQ